MSGQRIVHLVDDTTAGGVMRMLTYLVEHPGFAPDTTQRIVPVNRHALSFGRIDADVIVSHLTLSWRGLPALVTLRAMHPAARLLHIEHSYTRAFTALNVTAKRRFFALLRVGYALFDTVIAVSRNQAEWLRDRALVADTALQVIEPQVDLAGFAALAAPHGPVRVIGAMGRLERQKGFDILIEAFRQTNCPDARLMICGDGSERDALAALAEGDSRISFRSHGDPVQICAGVDAIALPSRWEAFGIVAREAISAGRHVCVASVDGLSDLAPDRVLHIRGGQIHQWTRALNALFDGTHALCDRRTAYNGADDYAVRWQAVYRGTVHHPRRATGTQPATTAAR